MRRAVLGLILALVVGCGTALAKEAQPQPSAGEYFAQAIGNTDIAYIATRTSLFWSENGKTRALVTRVYKDRNRVLYEYPARGNHPPHRIIETPQDLYFIRPEQKEVTVAHRQPDTEVDGVRVKLALSNYRWEYEHSHSPSRIIVAAYAPDNAKHARERFWIAPATHIVVRAERYGAQGELLSSWSLDQVHTVDSLPDQTFEPKLEGMVLRDISMPLRIAPANIEARAGFAPLIPQNGLWPRYELVDVFLEQNKDKNSTSVRLVYSDGLDSFSLLEAPRRSNKVEAISHAKQVLILDTTAQIITSAEATMVHWQDDKRYFTLIGSQGEAPMKALSRKIIVASQPLAAAPPKPPHHSVAQVLQHGWSRLLRLLGIRA